MGIGECTDFGLPDPTICSGNSAYSVLERKWLGVPEVADYAGISLCGCEVGCWAVDDNPIRNLASWLLFPLPNLGDRFLRPLPGTSLNTKMANGMVGSIGRQTNIPGQAGLRSYHFVPQKIALERAAVNWPAHPATGGSPFECFDDTACDAWPMSCSITASQDIGNCLGHVGNIRCRSVIGGDVAVWEKTRGPYVDLFFMDGLGLRNGTSLYCRKTKAPQTPDAGAREVFLQTGPLMPPMFPRSFQDTGLSPTPGNHMVNAFAACVEKIQAPQAPCDDAVGASNIGEDYYSTDAVQQSLSKWVMQTTAATRPKFLGADTAELRVKNAVLDYALRTSDLNGDGTSRNISRVTKDGVTATDLWEQSWNPRDVISPEPAFVEYNETIRIAGVHFGQRMDYLFEAPPPIWKAGETADADPVLADDSDYVPIIVFAALSSTTTFNVVVNGSLVTSTIAAVPHCDGTAAIQLFQILVTVGEWRTVVQEGDDALISITPFTNQPPPDCPDEGEIRLTLVWPYLTDPDEPVPLVIGDLPIATTIPARLARHGTPLTVHARLTHAKLRMSLVAETFDARSTADLSLANSPHVHAHARVECRCEVVYTVTPDSELPEGVTIRNPENFGGRVSVEGDTILYDGMNLPPPRAFSWWGWAGSPVGAANRWGMNGGDTLSCCSIRKMIANLEINGWPTQYEESIVEGPYDVARRTYGGFFTLRTLNEGSCS